MSSSPTPTDKTPCSKRQLHRKEGTKKRPPGWAADLLLLVVLAVLALALLVTFVLGMLWGTTG